jgi:restriction system protein
MAYKYISSKDLELVAEGLKDLKNQMVFVGGAVVGLYVDVLSAKELRPTEDIDMTITLASFRNWYAIQEQLSDYGFHPDPFGHAICSFKYQDIPVDIMPAEDSPLGPANKWYALGFNNIWIRKIHDIEIQILPAPCFLATKFEAFKNRGKDYRMKPSEKGELDPVENTVSTPEELLQNAWQEIRDSLVHEILDKVKSCTPDFFEKLVVDLMLAMGYGGSISDAGIVTPSSRDGGIDGLIKEDKLGLDLIYLQAKRWEGTVGRPEIEKFIGALAAHGANKGVFITTGRFSKEARDYIPRNDTRIIHIDGARLAQLMIEHNLGVSIQQAFHLKRMDTDYFEEA